MPVGSPPGRTGASTSIPVFQSSSTQVPHFDIHSVASLGPGCAPAATNGTNSGLKPSEGQRGTTARTDAFPLYWVCTSVHLSSTQCGVIASVFCSDYQPTPVETVQVGVLLALVYGKMEVGLECAYILRQIHSHNFYYYMCVYANICTFNHKNHFCTDTETLLHTSCRQSFHTYCRCSLTLSHPPTQTILNTCEFCVVHLCSVFYSRHIHATA